ncbi:MAG: MBL fold metallo-hydrolase [Patescibacteria group bacterium]
MHVYYLGGTAVKLQTKDNKGDVTIVIDPYKPEDKGGTFPPTLAPDIALYSRGQEGSITLQQHPFVIDTPGEFEVRGVMIYGIPTADGLVYQLSIENMLVLHTGALKNLPDDKTVERLSSVDVLLVPVGGHETLDAKKAGTLTTELEPRAVIPIAFRHGKNDPKQAPVDPFLKEIGHVNGAPQSKAILVEAKLPNEDMEVIVLASE